jgi:putative ABC transport system permease protein
VIRRRIGQRTRLRPADAIGEAFTAIAARPARAFLTSLGTLLGVAWFVTALGLVSTASGQVAATFADRLATQVTVRLASTGPAPAAYPYPADVSRRLEALNGVLAAGVYWQVKLAGPVVVSAAPGTVGQPSPPSAGQPAAGQVVIAASPGFLAAAGVQVSQGRTISAWAQAHAAQVCLLGSAAAKALGVTDIQDQPAILINNEPCAVIGIFSQAIRRPALLRAVLLPTSTAVAFWGAPDQQAGAVPTVLIQTRPGAAAVVGRQAPYAISPARPGQFAVIVPVRPQRLRDQVTGMLTSLFFALGWVSLAIGALSIASVTWLSVRERSAEYGLRRAVGARRGHILAHVVAESTILGLIGGLAGAGLGVAAVILLARSRQWVPVIAPLTVLPAPLAGAAAGVLAGLIPGIHAARTQPAMAFDRAPVS